MRKHDDVPAARSFRTGPAIQRIQYRVERSAIKTETHARCCCPSTTKQAANYKAASGVDPITQ